MEFQLPKELSSIIKVVGVGGGGGNAVNHMYEQGIRGVDFIVCNTDRQALDMSPVPVKLQLGAALTEGLGAGAKPERGKEAAQENLDEIRQLLGERTKMLFITAGMGGGTGTGAAPVIARVARELGILTVGIVTSPFTWEGRRRKEQAATGITELRDSVDSLLVINNDRLRELFGNLTVNNAFDHADNVLSTAARGIAEIITETGTVNVDFEDVKTVMTDSGVAIMGMAEAEGEDRALAAATEALASPLLNDNDISGAKYVLLNIAHGVREVLMDEIDEITNHIQDAAGSTADVIWGYGHDESLGEKLRITVIATGFQPHELADAPAERKVTVLTTDEPRPVTRPIDNPVATDEPYLKQEPAKADEEAQGTIEFEVRNTTAPRPPAPPAPVDEEQATVRFDLDGEPIDHGAEGHGAATGTPRSERPDMGEARPDPADHQQRVEERQARMREMSTRVRTSAGLSEMEREPAYKRRQVQLSDTPRSDESNVSRFSLSETTDESGERRVEMKRNNAYLHDNVD